MNAKEMAALVQTVAEDNETLKTGQSWLRQAVDQLQKGRQEDREAHMHLIQRADNIVEGFKKELAQRDDQILALSGTLDQERRTIAELRTKLDDLTAKVEGRNKSAPVKRNMVDADAREVLVGKFKDLAHKEAAEAIGLTYAQVYSCRLEFTFKHVHKELRDAGEFVNPWTK